MRCCSEESICACANEIDVWRNYFLDELFAGKSYKFIPEEDKNQLRAYFMSIPSSSFKNPWMDWHDCVSALLQFKKDRK